MENETQTETAQTEAIVETQQTEAPQTEVVDNKEWFKSSKYKTVEDQAKAYSELEKKLGGFVGSPESYALREGIEIDADTPLLKGLDEIGKKYGMNNEMYNDIISMYSESETAELENFKSKQMEDLGSDGAIRIQNINDWTKVNATPELREFLERTATTANDVTQIEALIALTKGQKLAPSTVTSKTPSHSEEELQKMVSAKNERGQRLLSVDPGYRAKVNEYRKNLLK